MRMLFATALGAIALLIVIVSSCNSPIAEVETVDRVVTRVVEATVEVPVEIAVTEVIERVVEVQVPVEKEVEVTRIVVLDTDAPRRELTIWISDNSAAAVPVYESLAAQFSAENPTVRVTIEPIDQSSLAQRITTARSANRLPDLIQLDFADALLLSAENLLDPALTANAMGDIDDFNPHLLDMVTVDAELVAVPFSASGHSLWFRSDVANLTGRNMPTDWNAVTTRSERLTTRDLTQFGLVLPTDPNDLATQAAFEHVALSVGATPFDAFGNPRFDSPEFTAALSWYANMSRTALPGTQDGAEAREAFRNGLAVMLLESTPFVSNLIAQDSAVAASEGLGLGDKIGRINTFTIDGDQRSLGALTTVAILRGADEEAAAFVNYLLNEGYEEVLAIDPYRKLPVRASANAAWKNQALTTKTLSGSMLDDLLASASTIDSWRMNPDLGPDQLAVLNDIERERLIGQIVFAVANERTLTPQQGADFLQEQINALLSLRRGTSE